MKVPYDILKKKKLSCSIQLHISSLKEIMALLRIVLNRERILVKFLSIFRNMLYAEEASEMIRIGICDDEPVVYQQVKECIKDTNFGVPLDLVYFESGSDLLKYNNTIDILLLDICIPGMDGIEIGHQLREKHIIGKIIMLTSMVERFQEAFEIEAYRFVTKPIDKEKLVKAIQEAIGTFIGCDIVEVYLDNRKYTFQQRKINYISKDSSRTEVIIGCQAFRSGRTLGEWEKELDNRLFFQVHKSYIVNLSQVDRIEDKIYLKSGEILPIAKRRRNGLIKQYMQYDLRYR